MRNNLLTAARDAVTPSGDAKFSPHFFTVARVLCQMVLVVLAPLYAVIFVMLLLHQPGTSAFALMGELLKVLVIGLLFETAFAALWCWLYPVRVGDSGVVATDFWGRKLTLSWGEMETVEETRFCGLPYLKVASFRKDRAVLWLPLFVTKPDALKIAIVSSASAQNPLRQFVEGNDNMTTIAAH